jgi:hypothetical protein
VDEVLAATLAAGFKVLIDVVETLCKEMLLPGEVDNPFSTATSPSDRVPEFTIAI